MTRLEATISEHVEHRLAGTSVMEDLLAEELSEIGLSPTEIGIAMNDGVGGKFANSENPSDQLFRTARITAHAIRVFGDTEKATSWLRATNGALRGRRPIELLRSDAGAYAVEEVLHRVDFGIFS